MLSDLSVSAHHQRRRRPELQVCFRRRVTSVLGPHQRSNHAPPPHTHTKVKRRRRSEQRLTYDLFTSKRPLTTRERTCLRTGDDSAAQTPAHR